MKKTRHALALHTALVISFALAGGSSASAQDTAQEIMEQPINCDHAQGDLRVLEGEKSYAIKSIAEGIFSITPTGMLIGALTKSGHKGGEVDAKEYEKHVDERIAEIKKTCNL